MTGQDQIAKDAEAQRKQVRDEVIGMAVKSFDQMFSGFEKAVNDMKVVVAGAYGEEVAFDVLTRMVLPVAAIYSRTVPETTDAAAPSKREQVIASVFLSMPEQVLLDMGPFLASAHGENTKKVVVDYLKGSVPGTEHTCETMRYDAAEAIADCYAIKNDLASGALSDLAHMQKVHQALNAAADRTLKLQAPQLQMIHMVALDDTLSLIERAIEFKQNDLAIAAAAQAAETKSKPASPAR